MPSKFTAERIEEILRAKRLGASNNTAAAAGGVDEKTLRDWVQKGEKAPEGSPYRQFFEDFRGAVAFPNVRALEIVHQAMQAKPELAWKFLERKEPGYAPVQTPVAPAVPVLIGLSLGHEAPTQTELVEGTVIDVPPQGSASKSGSTTRPRLAPGKAS